VEGRGRRAEGGGQRAEGRGHGAERIRRRQGQIFEVGGRNAAFDELRRDKVGKLGQRAEGMAQSGLGEGRGQIFEIGKSHFDIWIPACAGMT